MELGCTDRTVGLAIDEFGLPEQPEDLPEHRPAAR